MTDEPDWINPANHRKTPYTDEELEVFVDGFIGSFTIEWRNLKTSLGVSKARQQIKNGFIAQHNNNLFDIKPDDITH